MITSKYTVINSSDVMVIGYVEVDGEQVEYKRKAQVIELTAEAAHDQSGTIKLVATGEHLREGAQLQAGDQVTVTFEKATV